MQLLVDNRSDSTKMHGATIRSEYKINTLLYVRFLSNITLINEITSFYGVVNCTFNYFRPKPEDGFK